MPSALMSLNDTRPTLPQLAIQAGRLAIGRPTMLLRTSFLAKAATAGAVK